MQGAPGQAKSSVVFSSSHQLRVKQINRLVSCPVFQKLCLQSRGGKGRGQVKPQGNATHLYRHAWGACPTLDHQEEIALLLVVLGLEFEHWELPHLQSRDFQTFQSHVRDLLLLRGSSEVKRTHDYIHPYSTKFSSLLSSMHQQLFSFFFVAVTLVAKRWKSGCFFTNQFFKKCECNHLK